MDFEQPDALPDEAIVCRGGTCAADRFRDGSGVSIDTEGRLRGVSVNCAPAASLAELTTSMPHRWVGATTVGDIRRLGGSVTPAPARSGRNHFHCILDGITAEQAAELFTPPIANPNR